MALTYTPSVDLGEKASDYNLFGMDGRWHSLEDHRHSKAIIIMFICNHCPYVKAIEDRLIQLAHDCRDLNIAVVAVCSNDSHNYPEDSYENLQKRWKEKEYPFIYLHDPDQTVAKAYGAVCTPDFFLYDEQRKLVYRGRLDDSWKDPEKVTRRELFGAAKSLVETGKVPLQQLPSMGCSIKWFDV